MQKLTDIGEHFVNELSSRYGLSQDAIVHMLVAVNNGGGSMAQFNCPELGGSGQWMRGGMTMVGDMFNNGLKMTVDNLCNELANVLANNQVFPVIPAGTSGSNHWWPIELGQPFSSGAQNNVRYAIFPNRLAIELNGQISIYDTLDHNIGGVSQQQGVDDSLTFSSQWGNIHVSSLPLISGQSLPDRPNINFAQENNTDTFHSESPVTPVANCEAPNEQFNSANQMIAIITKLAELKEMGVLTEEEFTKKKTELLNKG